MLSSARSCHSPGEALTSGGATTRATGSIDLAERSAALAPPCLRFLRVCSLLVHKARYSRLLLFLLVLCLWNKYRNVFLIYFQLSGRRRSIVYGCTLQIQYWWFQPRTAAYEAHGRKEDIWTHDAGRTSTAREINWLRSPSLCLNTPGVLRTKPIDRNSSHFASNTCGSWAVLQLSEADQNSPEDDYVRLQTLPCCLCIHSGQICWIWT